MSALPALNPVTVPLELTDATAAFSDCQLMFCPDMIDPPASSTCAVSLIVAPMLRFADVGEMRTTAAGSDDTLTGTTADTPPLLAAICVLPGLTPVTTPVLETVAT